MTLVLVDILERAVIVAADRFQFLGGGPTVTQDNNAVKLVSNQYLLVALHGDWPIAPPLHTPHVWFDQWLNDNSTFTNAKNAALCLKQDLENLRPSVYVKGGGIILASCSKNGPQAEEISGGSESEEEYRLKLSVTSLSSPSDAPIPRGVFNSWTVLNSILKLSIPSRSDTAAREQFLKDVIERCERHRIPCVLGPALVESRTA